MLLLGNQFVRFFKAALLLKLSVAFFYFGYRNAVSDESDGPARAAAAKCAPPTATSAALRQKIDSRVEEELARLARNKETIGYAKASSNKQDAGPIFPRTARNFAAGALLVKTEELLGTYDFGVPIKAAPGSTEDSLILYNTARSLPPDKKLQHAAVHGRDHGIANASVPEALRRCDALNVVFASLRPSETPECLLLVGNFESYHVNRWMRMPAFTRRNKRHRELNHTLPLRHVGRITYPKGADGFSLPELWDDEGKRKKGFLFQHLDNLRTFLENVDAILAELKDLLRRRDVVRDNTVVVMTVNSGQKELFANFICAARSRGFDTGNMLVFPTDEASHNLAQGLGVATYFDRQSFGALPSEEATKYGDPVFASMMYAKVLCVLYVSLLGHDVLFQDVDVVWFKDPVAYFHDESNAAMQSFDILFQHDGSAQPRYSPFSANSGFYYVRANKKTQYLFTSLLYHGALIRKSRSHQQVLVQLLNEHSSMFGLHVKVFDKRRTDLFPGGFHYHQDWAEMRKIVRGESNAYLLHMSWTENKVNKLLFFRQMGEWYFKDECIHNAMSDSTAAEKQAADGGLVNLCCSKEPIFSCHFKDKPSKHPCPDSPRIDTRKEKTFWK